MNTIQIGAFTIEHEETKVIGVRWPDDYPTDLANAAADCIEAMAVEIIKMRELLQDTVHAFNNDDPDSMLRAYNDALDYINSLPK